MLVRIPSVLLYKFKGSGDYPARLSKLVIDIPQVLSGTKIRPRFYDKHYEYQGLMRPTLPRRTRMAREDHGIRFDPKSGPGFHPSHPHDSGPGPTRKPRPHAKGSVRQATSRNRRKTHVCLVCSDLSENPNQRKQKGRSTTSPFSPLEDA